MAFSDKIRFRDDESRRIEAEWAEQFKKLSGYDWPPQDAATWTIILTNAGFSQLRIEQCLTQFGHPGFEDAGDPPCGYLSAGGGGWPTFSAALVAGLERWRASLPNAATAGEGGGDSQLAGVAEQPSLEARALAMLTDHPDWTDKRIAQALQCNRGSLYRLEKFKAARELLKRDGRASATRGCKNDGRIDAWKSSE